MTTEATAGLLGPSEETLETFGAASVNMKALIDYTDWFVRLFLYLRHFNYQRCSGDEDSSASGRTTCGTWG